MNEMMVKLIAITTLSMLAHLSQAQQKYVFVFLNSNPDKEVLSKDKVDSLQEAHLANIQRLAKEDKLHVAGPFVGGGGIFILNTDDIGEAKQWINTDPAIHANRYKIEVLPWSPNVGKVCLVDESAEMVPYTFVRFLSHITKFNVQQAPELFMKHDKYINEIGKTGNIVSAGVFDNSDGSTLIMKGNVNPEVIMNDPAVKNGILEPTIKTIWVGKGSFCEN